MQPTRIFITVLLCHLLTPTNARLTHSGLPHGQTIAPTGADHFHPTLATPPRPPPRTRGNRQKQSESNLKGRRSRRYSPSEDAPFHTLRNSACGSPGQTHTLRRIITKEGSGLIRTVSSSQLSALFSAASSPILGGPPESVVVLFHGGRSCQWSAQIWPVWLEVQRAHRALCLVTIDAAKDSMLNYNLMVLGFPTLMRVTADRSSETFRGNRTKEEVVAWMYRVTGVPPMSGGVMDEEWMGVPEGVWDLRGDLEGEGGVNWALVGANVVSVLNVAWLLVRGGRALRRRVVMKIGGGEGGDDVVATG